MIPVNNFIQQQQQQQQQEFEFNTYYPKFVQQQQRVTRSTSNGSVVEIQQQKIGQQQLVNQTGCIGNIANIMEDVCISGVSGRFPECENVEEFAQNLLNNGCDMIINGGEQQEKRFGGLSKKIGTTQKNVERFNAQFFGMNGKQVEQMDQQTKMMLEVCYEAIFDSGINPAEIRGTRTGVFIGADANQDEKIYSSMTKQQQQIADRLSYFFDFKGPSYTVDTTCQTSLVAFDAAVQAIKTGQCDYAIVGDVNVLSRQQQQQQQRFVEDEQVRCYETAGVVFIQRKSTCRRFYAKVVHSKCMGEKQQQQRQMLREIYSECQVDPTMVTFVECHNGEKKIVVNGQDMNTIADIFVRSQQQQQQQRTQPLLIGSTRYNIYGRQQQQQEPVSAIASLIKMIISIQTGIIPANNKQCFIDETSCKYDARIKFVQQNTKLVRNFGGLMALNSCGNVNAHVLIQPNFEQQTTRSTTPSSIWCQEQLVQELAQQPRLFQCASQTEQGVQAILDQIESTPMDLAAHALLQPHSEVPVTTHQYRGYTILNSQIKQVCHREIKQVTTTTTTTVGQQPQQDRPVWFVFNGIGSQWSGMGQDMMKIDSFRQSIIRSSEILKSVGVDLIELIYGKPTVFETTLNAFVGIAAIQIALVDCLRQAGIEADGLIGHSIGELVCAYADKCFTQEETLLTAYYRGKCIEESQLPQGAMATVGLTWEECQRRCPSGVVPACHNSQDTVTISGPRKAVCDFVEQLRAEGIFAKEVESSNVAFHSYYMTSIAPTLKTTLAGCLRTPMKPRSSKWISTSIPEQRWGTELGRFSSPDYHVNNLCSPVLFQEALRHIPTNAITIEIGPHSLLQAILKRTLCQQQQTVVALLRKDVCEQAEHFLTQLGRMYCEGINVNSFNLCVPSTYVQQQQQQQQTIYPVPVSTRFLSPLIRWGNNKQQRQQGEYVFGGRQQQENTTRYTVDVDAALEDAYLLGHQIDGRVIYPTSGYLHLVWRTLAARQQQQQQNVDIEQVPIVFENVEIHRETILKGREQQQQQQQRQSKKIIFEVSITPVNGLFEVVECGQLVASGKCYVPESQIEIQQQKEEFESWTAGRQQADLMQQDEIYKELRMRGYEYQGEFQTIVKADVEGTRGDLMWTTKGQRWVPFLDAIMQINVLGQKRGLLLPTRIRSLRIDPRQHLQQIKKYSKYVYGVEQQQQQDQVKLITKKFNQILIQADKNVQQQQQQQQVATIIPCVFDQYTNTTVCGGVEISGLHAQVVVAPRRQQQYQPTIVERVNFVPYVERPCEDDYVYVDNLNGEENINGEDMQQTENTCHYHNEFLEHYLSEIKRYTQHILRKIEYPKSIVQTILPNAQTPSICNRHIQVRDLTLSSKPITQQAQVQCESLIQGGRVLELLTQAANIDSTDGQYLYRVQKLFTERHAYMRAVEEDRVLNYLNKKSAHLKSLLDIVVENTPQKQFVINNIINNNKRQNQQQQKLRILEITTPTFTQIFGVKCQSFFKSHPQLDQIDYEILPIDLNGQQNFYQQEEYLNEIINRQQQQQQFQIKRVQDWTCYSHKQPFQVQEPPMNMKNQYDLVIFNGCLSQLGPVGQQQEMKQWIQQVVQKVCKPTGFMMVHEYTNNFETMTQLNQLERIIYGIQQQQFVGVKHQNESQWRQMIDDSIYCTPVAVKSDGQLSTMFLYRRCPFQFQQYKQQQRIVDQEDDEEKIFIDDVEQFSWLEKVKQALANQKRERVWLISEKQPNSGIVGLVNCLRRECGGEKIRCVFITDRQPIVCSAIPVPVQFVNEQQQQQERIQVSQWTQLFDQIKRADLVMNVFSQGKWGSFRHVFDNLNIDQQQDVDFIRQQTLLRNACINMMQRGDLTSFKWMQTQEPFIQDQQRQVVCQVGYAALNIRDIMFATGRQTPETIMPNNYYQTQDGLLGMEFSGYYRDQITQQQRRCMGMVPAKGLATRVVVDTKYLWQVPAEWTMEEAATVPVAYSTAYYALCVRGGLKQGERVLIHSGCSAVGQAAIAIALSYGCQVFVTVSSQEKREYLKALFPGQLTEESFANSRDIQFEQQIMQVTQGKGVHVVLNSLNEEKLQASIRVLAQHGRFLEIGKFDLNKNSQLGMSCFLKNISFHGISVDALFEQENVEWKMVQQLVEEGIRTGVVRPLRATVFEIDQIEEAFRFMAQGQHIGKVLVKVCRRQQQEQEDQDQDEEIFVQGLAKVWFKPQETYIVTGGLGNFGLELTQWLCERGARRIILTSRTGVRTGYQTRKLKTLKDEFVGCQIQVLPYDVKEENECDALIQEACQMSPVKKIGGVFHLAAVQEDALFENQTAERFRLVTDVKYLGAYNLDKCTRSVEIMDPSAYFVVFSSNVVSGRGVNMVGQTNYGYANSAMERICEQRRRDGRRHALAIQWGAIADATCLIGESNNNRFNLINQEDEETISIVPQRIVECLKTLEHLMLKSQQQQQQQQATWSSFVPSEQYRTRSFIGQQQQYQQYQQQECDKLRFFQQYMINGQQMPTTQTFIDTNNNSIQTTITRRGEVERCLMPKRIIEKLNQVELVGQQTPLFVIHPIEGDCDMLKSWARHMKYPVFGVQCTQEVIERCETIEQLAAFYCQQIEKELLKQQQLTATTRFQRVHLSGYMFGASIAYEMALQRPTMFTTLTMLNGGVVPQQQQQQIYNNNVRFQLEAECDALYTFVQQYFQQQQQQQTKREFVEMLMRLPTCDQRVQFVVREIINQQQQQQQQQVVCEPIELEQAVRSYVARVLMANKYQPTQTIRLNQILLVKSQQQQRQQQQFQQIGEDFGLGQVYNGRIQIRVIDGEQKQFLEGNNGFQVASMLNEYLLACC